MYCIRAFLPLLLLPFPSTSPYFVILYYISLYRHHGPCKYCVFTVILLLSTTCYWGADRCWVDLNNFHIFDPIRHMDGTPTSTFGLQLPTFMSKFEDLLEGLLHILGGGEPFATVVRAGTNLSAGVSLAAETATSAASTAATTVLSAMSNSDSKMDSITGAVAAVLSQAAGGV